MSPDPFDSPLIPAFCHSKVTLDTPTMARTQDLCQPAFDFGDGHPLAAGVVYDLIAAIAINKSGPN